MWGGAMTLIRSTAITSYLWDNYKGTRENGEWGLYSCTLHRAHNYLYKYNSAEGICRYMIIKAVEGLARKVFSFEIENIA